jgi:hypothetical protein
MYILSRVRPPLTIVEKPLMASFLHSTKSSVGSGKIGEEIRVYVRSYRNKDGDTRTDLCTDSLGNKISAAILWRASSHESAMISFDERQIFKATRPCYPSETAWLPDEQWKLKNTNEQKVIHDLVCNRVLLEPGNEAEEKPLKSECWVSYELGLVVLDIVEFSNKSSRWEVIDVQQVEPAISFEIEVPQDFTQL